VIAVVILAGIIKKKGKKEAYEYIWNYIKIALLGIIIFPSNLLDIFAYLFFLNLNISLYILFESFNALK